jgi:putative lipoic acid-binding regulatory protein
VRSRRSAQGAYLCISVVVRLESFAQLQTNYQALRAVPELKYLL